MFNTGSYYLHILKGSEIEINKATEFLKLNNISPVNQKYGFSDQILHQLGFVLSTGNIEQIEQAKTEIIKLSKS